MNIYGGSWWNANLTMLSALRWAGYEVENAWGEGGHNGKHGGAILPDAMRWLWKDSDKPIETDISEHPELKDRLIDGEGWQLVSDGHAYTEGPAVSPDGNVFFVDGPRGEIWKVNDGGTGASKFIDDLPGVSGLMFDAEGNLYVAQNTANTITRIANDKTRTDIFKGDFLQRFGRSRSRHLLHVARQKAIHYLPFPSDGTATPKSAIKVGDGPEKPNGLIVTPDRQFLLVVDAMGRYVWSYKINDDGSLRYGQSYSYVHAPQDEMNTGADGATMTADGSLLVATKLGVQVFDQPGRVHAILDRPKRTGRLSNLVFAGDDMATLYATSGSSVFRRKTKMKGIAPWQAALTPPKPRL